MSVVPPVGTMAQDAGIISKCFKLCYNISVTLWKKYPQRCSTGDRKLSLAGGAHETTKRPTKFLRSSFSQIVAGAE
jgi:hypothetical protein